MENYSKVFSETAKREHKAMYPEDKARFEANTRLRLYVEKVVNPSKGAVSKPPKLKK